MNNFSQQSYPDIKGLDRFLSRMYMYMAGALIISGISAFVTVRYLKYTVFANPIIMLILGIISVVMAFSFSYSPNRAPSVSVIMLFIFSIIEGIFFSSILVAYTAQNITMAFISAATIFIVLSIFGLNTKKDLSRIGNQAMAALIALIVVSLINMFLKSAIIEYIFSYIGVIIFTILTAWDTQNMKKIYLQYGNSYNLTNMAINGALQLYLDFINMFLYLLQIFSDNNR